MIADLDHVREAFDGGPMRELERHANAIAAGFQQETPA
jgi:hypothetical protein